VDELFLMGVLDGKDVVEVPDDLIRSLVLRKARFPWRYSEAEVLAES
jgi:hypothetical protein